jgi:Bifunctional DNA primase/polymerase, N-terminal/Protein of unknown function (DUF3987)
MMIGPERIDDQLAHALAYVEAGLCLVAIPDRRKSPFGAGWNAEANLIATRADVERAFSGAPMNMGVVHEASGTVSLDVDHEAGTRIIFAEYGIDYDAIIAGGARIWTREGRDKVIYRAPAGLPLKKINWPQGGDDPRKFESILELRSGPNQCVLPPSIHPDTGLPYQWYPGTSPIERGVPNLPQQIVEFWRAVADPAGIVRDEIQRLCPWRKTQVPVRRPPQTRPPGAGAHQDVIGKFNAAFGVAEILERNGYKQRGKRYLSPGSSTGVAGVCLLDDGARCYSHGASDILADGHAHDAFDVLTLLEHNGDQSAALREVARLLDIERPPIEEQIDLGAVFAAKAAKAQPLTVMPAAAPPAAAQADDDEGSPPPDESLDEPSSIEPSEWDENIAPEMLKSGQRREPDYPKHLLNPPGMVGRFVDWIVETSERPQRMLAVGATLATFGAIFGRRVATESNARTNIYIAAVAETGYGKDHARHCIKMALNQAGADNLLSGEDFKSGAGLLSAVAKNQSIVLLIDELGLLLGGVKSKNAATHSRDSLTELMKLFSSSASIKRGTEYADQKARPRQDISCPNVCVYGTTIPRNFFGALDSEDIDSGFLNRFLIVEAPLKRPARRDAPPATTAPADIVDWIRASQSIWSGLERDGLNPLVVPADPYAKKMLSDFSDFVDAHQDALRESSDRGLLADIWPRAYELALKVALILSCSWEMDPERLAIAGEGGILSINSTCAAWAIDFVRTMLSRTEEVMDENCGGSDHERICGQVIQLILKAGERGMTIPEINAYSRKFRSETPRSQAEIIEAASKGRGEVVLRQIKSGSRVRAAYVHVDHAYKVEEPPAEVTASQRRADVRTQVAGLVREAGEKGMTARDICRSSRQFRKETPDAQDEILKDLSDSGTISLRSLPSRGNTRAVYVHKDHVSRSQSL